MLVAQAACKPLMLVIGQNEANSQAAHEFLQFALAGILQLLSYRVLSQYLRARHAVVPLFCINLAVVIMHYFVCEMFVQGIGEWEGLGFAGVPLALAVAWTLQLVELDLSGCDQITDLAPLASLRMLSTLRLSGCIGVTDLSPISGLRALETLDLSGNAFMSALTQRMREMLEMEMKEMGPVRARESREAQATLIDITNDLVRQDIIRLPSTEDEMV